MDGWIDGGGGGGSQVAQKVNSPALFSFSLFFSLFFSLDRCMTGASSDHPFKSILTQFI